jgi:hypothetical protein
MEKLHSARAGFLTREMVLSGASNGKRKTKQLL